MASTYFFLDEPGAQSPVLDWFRNLPQPPREMQREDDIVFVFDHLGPIEYDQTGKVDSAHSPAVIVETPRVRRQVFWTVGEVHFLTIGSAPTGAAMRKIQRQFQAWLYSFDQVFSARNPTYLVHAYFFLGQIQNIAERIFAFPNARSALDNGKYFIDRDSNDAVLDRVCKTLRLRGIECA